MGLSLLHFLSPFSAGAGSPLPHCSTRHWHPEVVHEEKERGLQPLEILSPFVVENWFITKVELSKDLYFLSEEVTFISLQH